MPSCVKGVTQSSSVKKYRQTTEFSVKTDILIFKHWTNHAAAHRTKGSKAGSKQPSMSVRAAPLASPFPFPSVSFTLCVRVSVCKGIYQTAEQSSKQQSPSLFWEAAKPAQKKHTNTHTYRTYYGFCPALNDISCRRERIHL